MQRLLELRWQLILFIANQEVASVYSDSPAVAGVASGLLLWVAAYHLADASQTLCVFVLRSYRITVAPLVVYCVLLWGLGLGGGYLVAYSDTGRVEQHGSITRCVLGVQCLGTARHRSGVYGDAGQGSSAFNAPRISVGGLPGKVTEKVEPLPSPLVISSDAPWRCSTCFTMASPRPVPPVSRERLRSTR